MLVLGLIASNEQALVPQPLNTLKASDAHIPPPPPFSLLHLSPDGGTTSLGSHPSSHPGPRGQ